MALFRTVYGLQSPHINSVSFDIFGSSGQLFPQDVRDGTSKGGWHAAFSPDGRHIAFAFSAVTSPQQKKPKEITNLITLFAVDDPSSPLQTLHSTKSGNNLSTETCSVVFHPTQQILLWTLKFAFTDKAEHAVIKLLDYGESFGKTRLITGKYSLLFLQQFSPSDSSFANCK